MSAPCHPPSTGSTLLHCAGLGPDPYSMRRSEHGAHPGVSPGAGPGSMLRSRSHSILPAAPRTVSRRRLGSQAGLTGSSEEGIPGAHGAGAEHICVRCKYTRAQTCAHQHAQHMRPKSVLDHAGASAESYRPCRAVVHGSLVNKAKALRACCLRPVAAVPDRGLHAGVVTLVQPSALGCRSVCSML